MTNSNVIQSQRPKHIPEYAEACLQALATGKLGEKISLGGAFGLLHYLDYRSTHDVDAWWAPTATAEDRRRVINVLEAALEPFGQVKMRAWGVSDCTSSCPAGAFLVGRVDGCTHG